MGHLFPVVNVSIATQLTWTSLHVHNTVLRPSPSSAAPPTPGYVILIIILLVVIPAHLQLLTEEYWQVIKYCCEHVDCRHCH